MARPTKLPLGEVRARLAALPGYALVEGEVPAVRRTYELPSFAAGIAFVTRLAEVADAMDHHPDIDIRYRRVTITLSTHDAGGVTELDLEQAAKADALAADAAAG